MAVSRFTLVQNPDGYQTFLRSAPGYIDARSLAATTNETVTIPTGATKVIFSANGDFYVNPNSGTAAVPGDVTDGSASEMNPAGYADLTPGGTFGIIAPAATVVTLAFYA